MSIDKLFVWNLARAFMCENRAYTSYDPASDWWTYFDLFRPHQKRIITRTKLTRHLKSVHYHRIIIAGLFTIDDLCPLHTRETSFLLRSNPTISSTMRPV